MDLNDLMNVSVDSFDFKSIIPSVDSLYRDEVCKYLESIDTKFDKETETIKVESWIEWAKRLKYLKLVNTDVPDWIFPKNCSGELIDAKVFSARGPDDSIYDTYTLVRDRVARGNCFLRITRGPNKGSRCILYALKKFTGGLGDDDDRDKGDNVTWKKYFIKPLDAAKRVVATRKANGEAAHMSCILLDGQFFICAGSKNVHILIRNRGDISFYKGDRYRIASEVCHSIMDLLENMEASQKERLLRFFVATRFTAVFEILSPKHQHVEDLSYLEKPVVKFITWTSTELEPMPDQKLCTVPPHIGIEIAKALGLSTIDYEVIGSDDVQNRMKQIRQGYQYEGEVLYFLDESNIVIGLLKKKTVWYIICRAIREKARSFGAAVIKNKSSFSDSKARSQVEKRLKDIQEWLGLSDSVIAQWKGLGIAFISWCIKQIENGIYSMEDIADRFPIIWKEHLKISQSSDQISVDHVECDEVTGLMAAASI